MNNLIYNLILGICASFLYLSCSEEPIRYELEIGEIESFRLDADSLSYFRTYQSSPEMGGLSKLYYGQTIEYPEIYSLVEVNPVNVPFFLDTTFFIDTTSTPHDTISYQFVNSIESVSFSLTFPCFIFRSDLFFRFSLFH